jgi:AcrR family transcriptional regulator
MERAELSPAATAGGDTAGSTARRGRRPPAEDLVERRRTEIIEAAYAVFSERGYQASGIADIAAKLGIGHGTFYRYFKNKRDILDQVVDYGVGRIVAALKLEAPRPAESLDEFVDQLRHIGERLFALLDAEPGLGSVVLLEATSIDEEMTQRIMGLLDTFGAMGAAYLQSGISRGFLRDDLDVTSLGRALTALTLPGLFAAVRGEAAPDERSRYIEAMVGLVVGGIARRPIPPPH